MLLQQSPEGLQGNLWGLGLTHGITIEKCTTKAESICLSALLASCCISADAATRNHVVHGTRKQWCWEWWWRWSSWSWRWERCSVQCWWYWSHAARLETVCCCLQRLSAGHNARVVNVQPFYCCKVLERVCDWLLLQSKCYEHVLFCCVPLVVTAYFDTPTLRPASHIMNI